jgi:amino acid transporter
LKTLVLTFLNLGLFLLFVWLLRQKNLLSFNQGGRVWLSFLAVGVITLMDELTSVFYAPAEAYRFIGLSAIFFIAVTSLLIRFLSTRLVEIAEILEHHGLIGGGVYSFSYLVLGPLISFIAVASIMVDYILTACISSVSAVLNSVSFFPLLGQSEPARLVLVLAILWGMAGLNILGIKENARFTFMIFVLAAFVFLNLIASGIIALDPPSIKRLTSSLGDGFSTLYRGSVITSYDHFISSVAFCILAYSGVESVLQTAGLVRNWREIRRSYIFLALTVGIVTPLVAALALSAPIDFKAHEGDLITHYATLINGIPFGVAVALLASFTLIMAVNTAFVASSELIERIAHRYGFLWLIKTNRRNSLYRIHLINAALFSTIIFITSGSQMILADMYAIGLVASFCINMGALLIYRYLKGTGEVIAYNTSRLGTLIIWAIMVSCFIFLAIDKPHGTALWASVTGGVLLVGVGVARRRSPELRELAKADNEMAMILYLSESDDPEIHLFFRRSEAEGGPVRRNAAYLTFYSPRAGAPIKEGENHFLFPLARIGLYHRIVSILKVVEYEFSDRRVFIHFGWPLSSWLDRLSIGVMVFNLMKLPRLFPQFYFDISYGRKPAPTQPREDKRA